jgi:uridine kinase
MATKVWEEKYLYPILSILRNTNTSQTVIFLRGISGSGKSTIASSLSQLLGTKNTAVCSADNYFIEDGIYRFESSKLSEAHEACARALKSALAFSNIRYIIVDNTHTRMWHLYNTETLAKESGAEIHYLNIVVPDKEHVSLCLKRQIHCVPDHILVEQWLNWEDIPNSINIPMFVSDDEKSRLP